MQGIVVSRVLPIDQLTIMTIHLLKKKTKVYLVIMDKSKRKSTKSFAGEPTTGLTVVRDVEYTEVDKKLQSKEIEPNDILLSLKVLPSDAVWLARNKSFNNHRLSAIDLKTEDIETWIDEVNNIYTNGFHKDKIVCPHCNRAIGLGRIKG
jgi:hypothetical protein